MKKLSQPQHNYLLREARVQCGWSQQELADRLGTTVLSITRWERGVTCPRKYFQTKLCTLFCKTPEELGLTQQRAEKTAHEAADKALQIVSPYILDPTLPFPTNGSRPLVGRQDLLEMLLTTVIASTGTFVLTGLPGMGKTALMLALAHHPLIQQHFCDGILWTGLGRDTSPLELLSRWGSLLGMSTAEYALLTTPQDWANALHHRIGHRRMLLLVDDAWKLEEALLFRLGGPRCVHLLTTRFPPLAYAVADPPQTMRVTTLHELCEEESLLLMQSLAPSIVSIYLQEIKPLLHTLGGLPLALQLIGRYLHVQGQVGSARRIRSIIERLTGQVESRLQLSEPQVPWESPSSLPPGMALSLQAAIALSEQTLQAPAQEALRVLSLFPPKPNSFSEEAALAVCQVDVQYLDQLVDAGLMEQLRSDRYQLHQTIADYARLQGVSQEAEKHFLAYFFSFVKQHSLATEALEQELPNIATAFQLAFERQSYTLFLEGVLTFAPFLVKRYFHDLATTLFAQARQIATSSGDQERQLWLWWYQGVMHESRAEYSQALHAYTQGLDIARALNRRAFIGRLLVRIGGVFTTQGESRRAEAYLLEGLALVAEAQDDEYLGLVLRYLGEFCDVIGKSQQANDYYAQALMYARRTQNIEMQSMALQNMGVKASRRGDYAQAMAYYQEALLYARHLRDVRRECPIVMNLGMLAYQQNRLDEAISLTQESLHLAHQIRHQTWISAITQNLGIFERERGHYALAQAYLQESLELAESFGHRWLICETQIEYGLLLMRQHLLNEAKHLLEKVLANVQVMGATLLEAHALFALAQLAEVQSNVFQARKYGEASLSLFRQLDDMHSTMVETWLNPLSDI